MALENIPSGEAAQIAHIVELTVFQLQRRYKGETQTLRGVHAKDHGSVTGVFEVLPNLREELRQGVFAEPGKKYAAIIRFSNASTLVLPDSTIEKEGTPPVHGSRGMAIKLLGVTGSMLRPDHGSPTQDFLMINQPVFAFANVEDYEVLSRVTKDQDDPRPFFAERLAPSGTAEQSKTPSQQRASETQLIVGRLRSDVAPTPSPNPPALPAYQSPPASPIDNDYFSASTFKFGPKHIMRYCVVATEPSTAKPNAHDPNYLRSALIERLKQPQAGIQKNAVVFTFEVQTLPIEAVDPDVHVENVSRNWPENPGFIQVATLTIPLQDFESPEARLRTERLVYSPWHGLQDHQPLGGINRMRLAVYEASAQFRNLPKEPGVSGCPFGH